MTIAPVFGAAGTPSTATDVTISYSGSIGHEYVVCGGSSVLPSAVTGVTDNGGNTWTLIETTPPSGTTGRRSFMYSTVATATFTTITVAHDHLGQVTASVIEVTGFMVGNPVDTHNSASHSGTFTPAAVTATPSNANSLEICIIQANTNNHSTQVNVPAGYTDLPGYNTAGPKIVYKVGPTAGVADGAAFTLTVSQGSGAVTAFFNAAILIAMSDSFTETESLDIAVSPTTTDSATETESMAIQVGVAISDSATETEALAIRVNVSMSDSATLTDSMTAGILIPLSDSATLTDSLSIGIVTVPTVVPPISNLVVGTQTKAKAYPPAFSTIGAPPQEVQDAITAGIVKIKRRVEIYESDGVTPYNIQDWDSRLNTGSITVDGARDERRMIDCTLQNIDLALNMDPNGGFYYDKILKAFWGVEYYSHTDQTAIGTELISGTLAYWETQIGEFLIDRIDEKRFPKITHVTGRDYTKRCLNSCIEQSETFDSTYPVEEIITGLAANAGIVKFRMPTTGIFLDTDVTVDIGTARWAIMQKVADAIGYEVYFTPDGYLTMRPYQDPLLSPLVFTYKPGPNGSLVDYNKSSDDSLLKNHSLVIGATVTDDAGVSTTAFGEAFNDDPMSPARRFNLDGSVHLGDRIDIFTSDYITAMADAQALANTRIRVLGLEEFSVDFSSLIIPWLDANDIIQVLDETESIYTPTRFLFSNFTLPLGLGQMTGTAKRVTVAGTVSVIGAQ